MMRRGLSNASRRPGTKRPAGPVSNAGAPNSAFSNSMRLEDQEWYHGHMPRQDINRMLTRHGDFLVRHTQVDGVQKYIISVFWEGKPRHVVLHFANGEYSVDPNSMTTKFPSIIELVKFHQSKGEVLSHKFNYILMHPVPRQDWELRHEQITLSKKLGEGAFGEVYLGTLVKQDGVSIPVAIKRSHEATQLSKEQISELMSECRLMQKLMHKNIVRVYGVAAEVQPIMIVMEFVAGGSLDSHLQKNKVTPLQKLKYCAGAAAGMAYLHSRDPPQIHRDIAARNMLLGENETVKVSDFGLATEGWHSEVGKSVDFCAGGGHQFKMTKNTKVPIRWLAPETLMTATYTLKTDVWAFGVMCWEVYNDGQEPYPGMRAAEVGCRVREGYKMNLDEVLCMQPPVKGIVNRCWNSDPTQRPEFAKIATELKSLSKSP